MAYKFLGFDEINLSFLGKDGYRLHRKRSMKIFAEAYNTVSGDWYFEDMVGKILAKS